MIAIMPAVAQADRPMALYRNVLTEGSLSVSGETPDGYGANAIDGLTYDFWVPPALPATLAVSLAAPVACDCAVLVAHRLGTVGAQVGVQHRTGGGAWITAATATPGDDGPLLILFAPVAAQEWRLQITGPEAAAIGVAMIGPRLVFPAGLRGGHVALDRALRREMLSSISVSGQFLGNRVLRKGGDGILALTAIARDWWQAHMPGFVDHFDDGRPFFWAAGPSLYPDDIGYCWRAGGEARPTISAGGLHVELSLQVASYAA